MGIKYVLYSLLTSLLLLSPVQFRNSCIQTEVTDRHVFALTPKLPRLEVAALVQAIRTTPCTIDQITLLSLLFIESSLKTTAVNHASKDFGIAQINYLSIKNYGLDKNLLLTNVNYSLQSACGILKEHRRILRDRRYWLGSYKAGTKFHKKSVLKIAKNYALLVGKVAKSLHEKSRFNYDY